jgi:hypothetical protein
MTRKQSFSCLYCGVVNLTFLVMRWMAHVISMRTSYLIRSPRITHQLYVNRVEKIQGCVLRYATSWHHHRHCILGINIFHSSFKTHLLLVLRSRKCRSCTSCHPNAPLWSVAGPLYLTLHSKYALSSIKFKEQGLGRFLSEARGSSKGVLHTVSRGQLTNAVRSHCWASRF